MVLLRFRLSPTGALHLGEFETVEDRRYRRSSCYLFFGCSGRASTDRQARYKPGSVEGTGGGRSSGLVWTTSTVVMYPLVQVWTVFRETNFISRACETLYRRVPVSKSLDWSANVVPFLVIQFAYLISASRLMRVGRE